MSELPSYTLEIADDRHRDRAQYWLWLSVAALLGAGVFSLLLVLARTPVIGEVIPYADFFHTALVIHVNLSVLVWTLSFAGALWSLAADRASHQLSQFVYLSIVLATVMLVVTGFLPNAKPTMSNYIPVLDHPLFLGGLCLFGIGIAAQVVTTMRFAPSRSISPIGVVRFGLNCTAIAVLMSLLAFVWSWVELSRETVGEVYYKLLFWGGGHVLQYAYTLLMMVGWLWLASVAGIRLMMNERVLLLVFLVGLAPVFMAPMISYTYDASHPMHRQMFTWLMSFGGSLATFPLGLVVYFGLLQRKPEGAAQSSAHAALMSSLLLFGAGGVIGFMIEGNDVTVPAHYHGCIVGVTLALMGVAYDLLPRLGYPTVNFRLAKIQLWTYASGQFLHILGLVWSGGYGVERKVAGAEQGLDTLGRVAGMGLMGLGGLISSIGGLLFIIIAVKAFAASRTDSQTV